MPNIQLRSSDDEVFDIDVKIAKCSVTISTMLEDLGMPEEEDNEPIPLPNVTGSILKKVLEWAEYHKNDSPVMENDDESFAKKSNAIGSWDMEFLQVSSKIFIYWLYKII